MILCFFLFSKIIPSFFTIKEGIFLPLRLSCKESSTSLSKPLPSQKGEDVTALSIVFTTPSVPLVGDRNGAQTAAL